MAEEDSPVRTRLSRGSSSVAVVPLASQDEDRRTEWSHRLEPDSPRRRDSRHHPPTQFLTAGPAGDREFGRQRPHLAASADCFAEGLLKPGKGLPVAGRQLHPARSARAGTGGQQQEERQEAVHQSFRTFSRAERIFFSTTARSICSPSPSSARCHADIASS